MNNICGEKRESTDHSCLEAGHVRLHILRCVWWSPELASAIPEKLSGGLSLRWSEKSVRKENVTGKTESMVILVSLQQLNFKIVNF